MVVTTQPSLLPVVTTQPSIPQPSVSQPSTYGSGINALSNLRQELTQRQMPPRFVVQTPSMRTPLTSMPSGSMSSVTSAQVGDETKNIGGVIYYKSKVQKGGAGVKAGNTYKVEELRKIADYLMIPKNVKKKDDLVDNILRLWDTKP
jgi:hypothetical protein